MVLVVTMGLMSNRNLLLYHQKDPLWTIFRRSHGRNLLLRINLFQELHPLTPSLNRSPRKQMIQSTLPRLSKQVSDGQIFGFTSPSRSSATEERLGNESQSDGWSMQAFSEMMAYSRRDSCSYDNECFGLRQTR